MAFVGGWFVHRVEATGPDGRRITVDVASKKPHKGSVTVRWDPRGVIEPRFSRGPGPLLYAAIGVAALAVAIAVWFFIG